MTEPVRRFPIVAETMARNPGAVKSTGEKKTGPTGPVIPNQCSQRVFCFQEISADHPARFGSGLIIRRGSPSESS
jgi:hypothetical protein